MQSSDNILPQTAHPKVLATPSYGQFCKDTKIGHFLKFFKGGTKRKSPKSSPNSRAPKTPRRKSHPLLISMVFKCNHRTTFCRKPRIQKCSQLRAMANLAKALKSAIFWNSSKGGPRENRPKSRPNSQAPKTPRRKFHPLLISMRLQRNHRTTFCRKPRIQKCSQLWAMANLAKTPKSAIFWSSLKGGPRENRPKSRPNSQAPKTPQSQEGLEITNDLTWVLLTWTPLAALSSLACNTCRNITGGDLGIMSKNTSQRSYYSGQCEGFTLLPVILSCRFSIVVSVVVVADDDDDDYDDCREPWTMLFIFLVCCCCLCQYDRKWLQLISQNVLCDDDDHHQALLLFQYRH